MTLAAAVPEAGVLLFGFPNFGDFLVFLGGRFFADPEPNFNIWWSKTLGALVNLLGVRRRLVVLVNASTTSAGFGISVITSWSMGLIGSLNDSNQVKSTR